MRRLWLRCLILAACCVPLGSANAFAQEQPAGAQPSNAQHKVVHIVLVGSVGNDMELPELLKEWLAPSAILPKINTQPQLTREQLWAAGPTPGVRLWVTLDGNNATLYFAEAVEHRYWVRNLTLPSGLDELGREQLAQVVVTSVQAFISRVDSSSVADIERSLAAATPTEAARTLPEVVSPVSVAAAPSVSTPAPAQVDVASRQFTLGFGMSYAALSRGTLPWIHSVGGVVAFERSSGYWALGVRVHGAYQFLRQVETPQIAIGEQSGLFTGSVSVRGPVQARLQVFSELGAGLQPTRLTPSQRSGTVTPRPAIWKSYGQLFVSVGPRWHMDALWLQVAATAAWDLTQTTYQLAEDAQTGTLLELPRLKVGLFAEVGFQAIPF